MTSVSNSAMPGGLLSGIEPLRAKWGWIVALGVLYTVAGFIALGSVMMATVASVFLVGVMMLIAGVGEVVGAFQMKSWGKFILWMLLGALYIVAGFSAFENPLLAAAWRGARGVGDHARLSRLQHEGADDVGLGAHIGSHHAPSRRRHPGALADFEPLHPGAVPRHRSHFRRNELDRHRSRPASAGVGRRLAGRAPALGSACLKVHSRGAFAACWRRSSLQRRFLSSPRSQMRNRYSRRWPSRFSSLRWHGRCSDGCGSGYPCSSHWRRPCWSSWPSFCFYRLRRSGPLEMIKTK